MRAGQRRESTYQDLHIEENLREGLFRSRYPIGEAGVDLVDVLPRRLEVQHEHARVVAALGGAVKVLLEKRPRQVELDGNLDDPLELREPDYRDGPPPGTPGVRRGARLPTRVREMVRADLPIRMPA